MAITGLALSNSKKSAVFLAVTCSLFVKSSSIYASSAPIVKKHLAATRQTNPETQRYLNNLRQGMLKNWELVDGNNKVVLEAVVGLDGTISELKSLSSSQTNALAIDSAKNALEQCKPLPSLPNCYKHSCKLTLTFSSTVDPHGDSNSSLNTEMQELPDVSSERK
jgi:hypothetical protein